MQGVSPLQIRTRVFDNLVFGFRRDKDAEDVFCSVKELTVAREFISSKVIPYLTTNTYGSFN